MLSDGRPIFEQVAEQLENDIVDGTLADDDQVPSTNELAAFHRINPATAAKVRHPARQRRVSSAKRRGIGMFVAPSARVVENGCRWPPVHSCPAEYVAPLVAEAHKLGIALDHLHTLLDTCWKERT